MVHAAMSLRIEQCENSLDALFVEQQSKARTDWEHARKAEALAVARGLARNPAEVVAQLAGTKQGVALMIERWDQLAKSLAMGLWDEADRGNALDLLGVDPAFRKPGQTVLDGPEDNSSARIGGVIDAEIARLRERLAAILGPADDLAREQAEASLTVLLSKPAALILRYEREAVRRFHAAMKLAHDAPKDDVGPTVFDPGPYPGPEPEPRPEPEPADAPPADAPAPTAESKGLGSAFWDKMQAMMLVSGLLTSDSGDSTPAEPPVAPAPEPAPEPVRVAIESPTRLSPHKPVGTMHSAISVHQVHQGMPRPNRRERRAEASRLRRLA